MYTQYFNLKETPFSITPDPAYLYMSPRHQEALGHLLYGTGQYGGFVQLTGEVGTGKTTVIRTLLEQKLDGVEVAMIHNPRQSEHEFVQTICDELKVSYAREPQPSLKDLIDALNLHLLKNHAQGRRTVLIIDEAQTLEPGVLEQVRLLTNLETHKEKLLRIMLVGQPELSELLSSPNLRQLASRITARYHLTPLEEDETAEYVRHRLRVAGSEEELFPQNAVTEIHRRTRGVPRLINALCDRALLGAYGSHQRKVTPEMVRVAALEVLGKERERASGRRIGGMFWRLDRRTGAGLPLLSLTWFEGVLMALALMIGGALIYQTVVRWTQDEPADADIAQAVDAVPTGVPVPVPAPDAVAPRRPAAPAAPAPPARVVLTPPPQVKPVDPAALRNALEASPGLPQLTSRLIRAWDSGIKVGGRDNVCRVLRGQGLECYRTSGSIKDLRQMDRPAILTVTDASGADRHVLVTQLATDRARVDTARGGVDVGIDDLSRAWNGDMLLLWRRETREVQLSPGMRGPGVLWLRDRLGEMIGKPASRSDRYDAALQEEVRLFQEARDLTADGVVGIRTRIALSDPAPGTPTLTYKP